MINNNKEEDPNQYHFDLPRFIIRMFLWTARFIMCLKVFNSGEPIVNMILTLTGYFIMEIGISFILSFIRYIPSVLRDPTFFNGLSKDQINDIVSKDVDFLIFNGFIRILVYVFMFFS